MLRQVRNLHQSMRLAADFSHVVIGGGIVGTAIAAELQEKNHNVLLVEQHSALGTETSLRNSEVIHAGLYYPPTSLKTQLCIRGKNKIYSSLPDLVGLKKCGKWIVAQSDSDSDRLHQLYSKAQLIDVPVEWVLRESANKTLPLIHTDYDVLHSTLTGIISTHDLILFFQTRLENAGGTIACNTRMQNIEKSGLEYRLNLVDVPSSTEFEILAQSVVNSAGLYAPLVSNKLLPSDRHFTAHFAKGNYYTYHHSDPDLRQKLIYPVPNPQATSLGTHLTFDLGGQVKFGPDLEWLSPNQLPSDLDYTPSSDNLAAAVKAIKQYYPKLDPSALEPLYLGVRPKYLSAEESKTQFADFIIREEEGFQGFINLIGIELPGVTSAWGIAEYVVERWG